MSDSNLNLDRLVQLDNDDDITPDPRARLAAAVGLLPRLFIDG